MERATILSGEFGYLFTLLLNKISLNGQQFDLVKVALANTDQSGIIVCLWSFIKNFFR